MNNSDKKLPPQVVFNFQEEDINPETEESNDNFIYSDEEENGNQLKQLEIIEKPQIIKEDIFEGDSPAPEPEPFKDTIKPVQVKEKKKRKPMSEEHKAKLKLAREKAYEVRKVNMIERKKMKEVDIEEKDLLKKQKIKRVKKLKEEVESDNEVEPKKPLIMHTDRENHITKKDLEDAQLDAIIKYEAIRKERKKEKKQAEMVENERLKMLNTINKATGGSSYRYGDGSNRFDNCY
tara:strand:+ start:253 stop:957 length:705 start_codon:yes stop_codon:yes gene_type:complete